MARFGWFFFAVGLIVSAGSVAWWGWIAAFDSTTNESGVGFLFAAGFWGGVIVAAFGAAAVVKARGMKTPPV
jgi:hypothetical protein